jgi:hypothetical protein
VYIIHTPLLLVLPCSRSRTAVPLNRTCTSTYGFTNTVQSSSSIKIRGFRRHVIPVFPLPASYHIWIHDAGTLPKHNRAHYLTRVGSFMEKEFALISMPEYPNQTRHIPQHHLGTNSDIRPHIIPMQHQIPAWMLYPNLDAQVDAFAGTSERDLGLFDLPTRPTQDHVHHPLPQGDEHLHMGVISTATQNNNEAIQYYGSFVPDLSDRIIQGPASLHSPTWTRLNSPLEPIITQPVESYPNYRRSHPHIGVSSGLGPTGSDWPSHVERSSMPEQGIEPLLEQSSPNMLASINTQLSSDLNETARSSIDTGGITSSQTSSGVLSQLPSPPPYEASPSSHSPISQPLRDSADALAEFVRVSFPLDSEEHARKRRALKTVMKSQWKLRNAFEPDENALLQFMKHDRKRSRWFCSFWKDGRPCESSCRKKDHAKGHIRFHIHHFPFVCQSPWYVYTSLLAFTAGGSTWFRKLTVRWFSWCFLQS